METSSLLDRVRPPLGLLMLTLAVATFLAHAFPVGGHLGSLLAALDLRLEGNLATVLEALLVLACGASFLHLSRVSHPGGRFEAWQLRFFQVAAGICVFLAADELFSFHIFLGRTFEADTGILEGQRVNHAGYSWLLFYGPACLAFLVLVRRACHRPARAILDPELRRRACRALVLALVAAPLALFFKAEEAWMANNARTQTMLPSFKEAMELIALWALLTGNLLLARAVAAEARAR